MQAIFKGIYWCIVLALLKRRKCKGDHLFDEQSFKSRSFRHFTRKLDGKQQQNMFMIFLFLFLLCS